MQDGFNRYINNIENLRDNLDYATLTKIKDMISLYISQKNNFIYMAGIGKNSDILHQVSKTYNSVICIFYQKVVYLQIR